ALGGQLAQLDWSTLRVRWPPLLGCAASLACVYALRAVSLRVLLGAYGSPITWRQAAVGAWLPPIAKFLPGQVFAVAGAVGMLTTFAVPGAVALAVVLIADALAVLTGVITGAPLLLREALRDAWPQGWILAVLAIAGGALCLHPPLFVRLLNLPLERLGLGPLRTAPPARVHALPVLLAFAQWIFAGAALWLMARSVTGVSLMHLPLFVPIAALAYTAGYLTPFAPAGLGIREAILQALLLPLLGAPVAVVVIGLRIVQTSSEIAMALTGLILLRRLETATPLGGLGPATPRRAAR
ncbi:MAG TPA: hypothetical protein VGC36_11500, partial [Rhizomicrobium sp.]